MQAQLADLFSDIPAAIVVLESDSQQFYFNGEQVSHSTLFEIGSVSKPLFALLASQLVANTTWSIDMPISSLLGKSFAHHNYSLTQLLTHRSGLPRLPANLMSSNMEDPYAKYDSAALKEGLAAPIKAAGQFEYSNFGYGLLGWLMAKQLNLPQEKMVHTYLFDPLNMQTAELALTGTQHVKLRGEDYFKEKVPNWHFDSLVGAGGVLASAQDMANWISAYWLESKRDKQLINAMAVSLAPLNNDMAYAWSLGQDGSYFHGGKTAGFNTMVVFSPKEKIGVIVMVAGERDAGRIAMTLFEQLQNKDN
mgnify:CR=1 FL=1